ncbi:unnamed protein product [Ilex paraguariensis]|uniref:Uncharacterized protein n=1 Tax=Ilex paraguariensis TaxID=185542 RepID=A0ABC8TN06_9AQUA
MLSAESFILNIDAKALSMDDIEFEKNMESARALLSGLSAESDDLPTQSYQNVEHVPRMEPTIPKQQALNSKKHQVPAMQPQFSPESSGTKPGNEEQYAKDQTSINKILSISDLENRGATILMNEDKVNQVFQDFPYLYSQTGDLTISDVEDLLNYYKQLAFKYICISKGLGVATPSPARSISQSQTQHHAETVEEPGVTPAVESHHAETVNESEVNQEADSSNEMHKNIGDTEDDSNGVSLLGLEYSDSTLPQDEAVKESAASQGEKNDEILLR